MGSGAVACVIAEWCAVVYKSVRLQLWLLCTRVCGYSCDCCVRECAVTVVILVYESVRLQLWLLCTRVCGYICDCCVWECAVTFVIVVNESERLHLWLWCTRVQLQLWLLCTRVCVYSFDCCVVCCFVRECAVIVVIVVYKSVRLQLWLLQLWLLCILENSRVSRTVGLHQILV